MAKYKFAMSNGGFSRPVVASELQDAYHKTLTWFNRLGKPNQLKYGPITNKYRVYAIGGSVHTRLANSEAMIAKLDDHVARFVNTHDTKLDAARPSYMEAEGARDRVAEGRLTGKTRVDKFWDVVEDAFDQVWRKVTRR